MLHFEGNIYEPSWRSEHQIVFEQEDNDVTDLNYSMLSVSICDWEANINTNVSSAFSVTLYIKKYSSPISDVAFCKAMHMRIETHKFSVSIGNCNNLYEPCAVFDIDKPSFYK